MRSCVKPSPSGASANTLQASAVVACSAFIWGCWWIPLREIDGYGLKGDWTSVAVLTIGGLCLAPFVLRNLSRLLRAGAMVWGAGLFLGAMFSTYQHGLITGDVVRVTLLFYLAPVWGTLLGIFLLGERFSWQRVAVILLGFSGAAAVLEFRGGVPLPRGLGEWMGLASGIAFAIGATFAHKVEGDFELEKTWLSLVCGAMLSALFGLLNPLSSPPSASQIFDALPFAIAVVVVILIPITWAMVWGAQRLYPGRISLLFMLEVVAAAVTSTLLGGEPFGAEKLIGTILVLTAGAVEALRGCVRPK